MSQNKAEEFAKNHKVTILNSQSVFPKYFATHSLPNSFSFKQELLKSSEELQITNLTSKIDELLGTTNNVFFALGKGYLQSRGSLGLLYDPFILANTPGCILVQNDLMYVLESTNELQNFCIQNKQQIHKIVDNNFTKIEQADFWQSVYDGQSLLISDSENSPAHTFNKLLKLLPASLLDECSKQLQKVIVKPSIVTKNLELTIKDVFNSNRRLMNTFSDDTSEEKVVELQIPNSYPIRKGLIAMYIS